MTNHFPQLDAIARKRDAELAARGLPEVAFVDNSADKSEDAARVIEIRRGVTGYFPVFGLASADELNALRGVTRAQREAMHTGSMMGWHVPGAWPEAYERGDGTAPAAPDA